jgi:hypothetical protein
MTSPATRLPRYPAIEECTWIASGKCRHAECRFSLLSDRPRIRDWDSEDFDELIEAMPSTCAISMASTGSMLLDEIATFIGLPRPQVEQIEAAATRKLARMRELRRVHWDSY